MHCQSVCDNKGERIEDSIAYSGICVPFFNTGRRSASQIAIMAEDL
jgi:hypothetical protein